MLDLELDLSDVAVRERPKAVKQPSQATTGPFFLDIETIPDFSREELFDEAGLLPEIPDDIPAVKAEDMLEPAQFVSQGLDACKAMLASRTPPTEWIDAVVLAENANVKKGGRKGLLELLDDVTARGDAVKNAIAERCKIMSCTPEMCRVVAIGIDVGGGGDNEGKFEAGHHVSEITDESETNVIDFFWRTLSNHRGPIVGFNVLGFDLPVLFVRSAMLGIEPTRKLDMRPWGNDVVDLMAVRYPKSKATGLKSLAKLYGIPIPAGDTDGGDVLRLFQTEPQKILEYVRSDVEVTKAMYLKLRGFFC